MERYFVAGHRGMVGSAMVRKLTEMGIKPIVRERRDLDLTDQQSVRNFFRSEKPDVVILAGAKVGGIQANRVFPAEFIYQNLMIETNVIHEAKQAGTKRLLFLGSSCIYPREVPQPISEDALLSSTLEKTNEPYAIAKIAGIKLCESYNRQYGTDFRSVMPTNLYGPGDNFHPENSHVIPALIRRFHDAIATNKNEVVIWGSGQPKREFMHVDDMAEASLFVINLKKEIYDSITEPMLSHINIGIGTDVSIRELVGMIAKITNFQGKITFDQSMPDGPKQKLLNTSKLDSLGWIPKIGLEDGLSTTYQWFKSSINDART